MGGLDSYDLDYGAYAKRIDEAVKLGETVVSDGHPKAEEVGAEVAKIKEDRAALEAAAAKKRSDLEKEHIHQMFKVKHSEVTAWLAEKQAFIAAESNVTSVASAEVRTSFFSFFLLFFPFIYFFSFFISFLSPKYF